MPSFRLAMSEMLSNVMLRSLILGQVIAENRVVILAVLSGRLDFSGG